MRSIRGPYGIFSRDLAGSKEFLNATDRSINTDRMADRECVLRFLAFHIYPWEKIHCQRSRWLSRSCDEEDQ